MKIFGFKMCITAELALQSLALDLGYVDINTMRDVTKKNSFSEGHRTLTKKIFFFFLSLITWFLPKERKEDSGGILGKISSREN